MRLANDKPCTIAHSKTMGGVKTRKDAEMGIATTSDPNTIMSNLGNDLKDIKTKKKLKRKSAAFFINQKIHEKNAARTILNAIKRKISQRKARQELEKKFGVKLG